MDQETLQHHMNILGVKRGASAETVRAAWKKKVKLTHPDLNPHAAPEAIRAVFDAYEALKEGVPAKEKARKSAPRQPAQSQPSQPAAPRWGAPEPYADLPLHEDNFVFDKKAQARLADLGVKDLLRHKHPLPERTPLQRLLGRPARYPIRTPREITCMWRRVVIELEDKVLPSGENLIVLPTLKVENGRLKPSDDIGFYVYTHDKEQKLRPRVHKVLNKLILPKDLSYFEIYFMTRSNIRLH